MPIPRLVARANRYLLNPLLLRVAGWLPPFMIIEHRGRTSGKRYRTPVIGFFESGGDSIVVVLTYGAQVDWLKNLAAADGGAVLARGHVYPVGPPTIVRGLDRTRAIPRIARPLLRLLRVSQFAGLPLRSPVADRG
jgi:deazaflavin-dependent oxidoreductase (nitroreductase family)